MSVLKSKRSTSKAEFVNVASQIYDETIDFLTRLSARYSRLMAEAIANLAGEVEDHAEKANSIFPSDSQRVELRKAHLLEARAALMALDVRLSKCYRMMNKNPQGCFTDAKGKTLPPAAFFCLTSSGFSRTHPGPLYTSDINSSFLTPASGPWLTKSLRPPRALFRGGVCRWVWSPPSRKWWLFPAASTTGSSARPASMWPATTWTITISSCRTSRS